MTSYASSIPLGAGRFIVSLKCQFCGLTLGTVESAVPRPSHGVCGPCEMRVMASSRAARAMREAARRRP